MPADVFRALADPSRRHLLDLLRQRDGRTLGELTVEVAMTRQAVTQHLEVLEQANLVSTVRSGRRKLHHLNPVPLHEISGRWLDRFDRPRLDALAQITRHAEEHPMSAHPTEHPIEHPTGPAEDRPTFRYVTYVRATAEATWYALTDADLTAAYWGHANVSDWQPGSGWEHRRTDGSGVADVVGTVLESDPPSRLVITFADPGAASTTQASVVTFEVEAFHEIVRLTVTHTRFPGPADLETAAAGWSAVLANLKTLLETGDVLPRPPWEMPVHAAEPQPAGP